MCFDINIADVFVKTTPVARKDHKCDECEKNISKGDKYLNCRIVSDGHAFTVKECRRCNWKRHQVIDQELAAGCRLRESDPGYGGCALHEALADGDYEIDENPPAEFVVGKRLDEVINHVKPCAGQKEIF